MPQYIELDSRKVTFQEYWNIVRSPLVIILWVAKCLQIPMKFGTPFPRFDSQREMEVAENEFAPEAMNPLRARHGEFLQLGFHSPRFFRTNTLGGETRTWFIGMAHGDGQMSVRLYCTISNAGVTSIVKITTASLTEFADGSNLVTGDQKPTFLNPPWVEALRVIGGSPTQLAKVHQEKLAKLQRSKEPKFVRDADGVDGIWDRYDNLCTEFGIKRGIYVKVRR